MKLDGQTIAVLAIVVAAVAYLARASWQVLARRKAAACSACASCPADGAEPSVVEIGSAAADNPPGARAPGPQLTIRLSTDKGYR